MLLALAAPALAGPEEAIDRAEWLWNNGRQSESIEALDQVVHKMEAQGDFGDPKQSSRAYWLQAQATFRHQRHCGDSFKAFVKLTTLNYLQHWPSRTKQYHALGRDLNRCVSEQYRDDFAAEALSELTVAGPLTAQPKAPNTDKADTSEFETLRKFAVKPLATAETPDSLKAPPKTGEVLDTMLDVFQNLLTKGFLIGGLLVVFAIVAAAFIPDSPEEKESKPKAPSTPTRPPVPAKATTRFKRRKPWG